MGDDELIEISSTPANIPFIDPVTGLPMPLVVPVLPGGLTVTRAAPTTVNRVCFTEDFETLAVGELIPQRQWAAENLPVTPGTVLVNNVAPISGARDCVLNLTGIPSPNMKHALGFNFQGQASVVRFTIQNNSLAASHLAYLGVGENPGEFAWLLTTDSQTQIQVTDSTGAVVITTPIAFAPGPHVYQISVDAVGAISVTVDAVPAGGPAGDAFSGVTGGSVDSLIFDQVGGGGPFPPDAQIDNIYSECTTITGPGVVQTDTFLSGETTNPLSVPPNTTAISFDVQGPNFLAADSVTLQGSMDGLNWYDVFTINGNASGKQFANSIPLLANYIRFTFNLPDDVGSNGGTTRLVIR